MNGSVASSEALAKAISDACDANPNHTEVGALPTSHLIADSKSSDRERFSRGARRAGLP